MSGEVESSAPASYIQRSMWAVAQRMRGVPLNVMMMPWSLDGHIDGSALSQALGDLVHRHPTLRSTLQFRHGELLQVTATPCPVDLAFTDLASSSPPGGRCEALALLRSQARQGFDIARGPLFRAHLIRLRSTEHVLCLFVHHAMCDAWSSEILIRDLFECYRARIQHTVAELAMVSQQYADYAREQMVRFEHGEYANELSYWRRQLADFPPARDLPSVVSRKGNRDYRVRSVVTTTTANRQEELKSAARRLRVSLFALLLAAVAVVVQRRTGSTDVLVGVSTVGRWTLQSREFVGCATNLLPARVRVPRGITWAELASQVHQTVRELMAYGRVPLELVLKELQEAGAAGIAMPVWAQLREPARPLVLAAEGVSVNPLTIERAAITCDIEFDFCESRAGIECDFAHRAALFDPAWIVVLATEFAETLKTLTTDSSAAVA